ncbi:lipocalin-like domain-containing protein [Hymenobacter terrenus]|uniref:lipocalin family protein n=1 Tax=Hymenobacter terrenus TaxID=1629124 RepID=UPI000619E09B|nr:lipocalin family protein [Hymenobacter terrenus]
MNKLTLLAAGAILFSACDDDKDTPPTPSRTDLLVDKDWVLKDYLETTIGSTTTTSVYAEEYDACEQDDFIRFTRPNLAVLNEGPTKCDPDDLQVEETTWTLANNDVTLTFNNQEYDISELTDASMKLTPRVVPTNMKIYTLVYAKK